MMNSVGRWSTERRNSNVAKEIRKARKTGANATVGSTKVMTATLEARAIGTHVTT